MINVFLQKNEKHYAIYSEFQDTYKQPELTKEQEKSCVGVPERFAHGVCD